MENIEQAIESAKELLRMVDEVRTKAGESRAFLEFMAGAIGTGLAQNVLDVHDDVLVHIGLSRASAHLLTEALAKFDDSL